MRDEDNRIRPRGAGTRAGTGTTSRHATGAWLVRFLKREPSSWGAVRR